MIGYWVVPDKNSISKEQFWFLLCFCAQGRLSLFGRKFETFCLFFCSCLQRVFMMSYLHCTWYTICCYSICTPNWHAMEFPKLKGRHSLCFMKLHVPPNKQTTPLQVWNFESRTSLNDCPQQILIRTIVIHTHTTKLLRSLFYYYYNGDEKKTTTSPNSNEQSFQTPIICNNLLLTKWLESRCGSSRCTSC